MTTHSKIGASSMYRWSVCPGSVRECAKVPAYSSSYAEEGTEAHDLAARCLTENKQAWDLASDAEQCEAVQVYLEHCHSLMTNESTCHIEHKFDLSVVYPGCFGTADFVCYQPATKTLHVVDYKHGAGLPVQATSNPQLMYYALGALLTLGYKVDRVCMTIVQPRCPHPAGPVRSYDIPAIDLLDFRADLIGYAKATEDANAPLHPGDHCRFCPAAAVCKALHAQAQAAAMVEFKPALPYDPVALAAALDKRDAVKAWLKNIDEFAYREAEAGRTPPGYKLVAKRAVRSWRSEGDTQEFLADAGLTSAQMYEAPALKSPAQIEAVFGKKNVPAALDGLILKESSGHTLVRASDPRPAALPSAASEFSPVAVT